MCPKYENHSSCFPRLPKIAKSGIPANKEHTNTPYKILTAINKQLLHLSGKRLSHTRGNKRMHHDKIRAAGIASAPRFYSCFNLELEGDTTDWRLKIQKSKMLKRFEGQDSWPITKLLLYYRGLRPRNIIAETQQKFSTPCASLVYPVLQYHLSFFEIIFPGKFGTAQLLRTSKVIWALHYSKNSRVSAARGRELANFGLPTYP